MDIADSRSDPPLKAPSSWCKSYSSTVQKSDPSVVRRIRLVIWAPTIDVIAAAIASFTPITASLAVFCLSTFFVRRRSSWSWARRCCLSSWLIVLLRSTVSWRRSSWWRRWIGNLLECLAFCFQGQPSHRPTLPITDAWGRGWYVLSMWPRSCTRSRRHRSCWSISFAFALSRALVRLIKRGTRLCRPTWWW